MLEHGFDGVLTSPDTFDDFAVRKQGRECDSRWTERAKTRLSACMYGESQGWYSGPDFHGPPESRVRSSPGLSPKVCVAFEDTRMYLPTDPHILIPYRTVTDSFYFLGRRGLRLVSISVNSEHFNLASKGADSQGHEELSHGHRQAPIGTDRLLGSQTSP